MDSTSGYRLGSVASFNLIWCYLTKRRYRVPVEGAGVQKAPLTGRDRAPGTFSRAIIVSDKSGDNRAARAS